MSFNSIPVLDLALANDPTTKPAFLADLRHALMEVGFLYIKNVGIPDELFQKVISEGRAFFDIPLEEKLKIEMKNAPSFLGYSRLSAEITAGATDHREQIDLSTEHPAPEPGAPLHHNLLAPNQWPSASVLPDFQATFREYMGLMGAMSIRFTSLIAEAIGLAPDAFGKYFDADQQHKLKIVRYPDVSELGLDGGGNGGGGGRQGVGPHKDSMLSSYLLQASHHKGLQVQNMKGEWVDCPPVNGTLVVAVGQGLEALTQGGVRGDAEFEDLEKVGVGKVPETVKERRRKVLEANGGRLDDVEFTFRGGGASRTLGEATLRNRIKSHPDVGERWYPDILGQIREEQKLAGEAQDTKAKPVGPGPQPRAVEAH